MGIENLYSHQSHAVSLSLKKNDAVIVTPTASGKTLCYNLPVLDSILKDKSSRALYLFPTKALAHDQLSTLDDLANSVDSDIKCFTYDGDTPVRLRPNARANGNIIITNPDMLNSGILPHHAAWSSFLQNLKYIVVDELHTYRGIFGSHMANIFARLLRICDFYGSKPVFICCSATIANPAEHAEALIGRHIELISENGAPSPTKKLIIYNPPVINRNTGIRRSALFETSRMASEALCRRISTIIFTRSRLNSELLLKTIRRQLAERGGDPYAVTGYRAGYLPKERRAIEQDLRSGKLLGVVSTNALELGIDIGSLELAILHGYPGSIASAWQQIGRAGRRGSGLSAALMVTSAAPADQFIAAMPDWFFGASPEIARINPQNHYIQVGHVKCSAFELPFRYGETFGGRDISSILNYFADKGVLYSSDSTGCVKYYWQGDPYPASKVSLRSAASESYTITDISDVRKQHVIGIMDKHSASALIFPGAIYFHKGQAYEVQNLDTAKSQCMVKISSADYYTEGKASERINIVEEFENDGLYGWGRAVISSPPTLYKKIRISTHETIGHGRIDLPESRMESTAFWLKIPREFQDRPDLDIAMKGISTLLSKAAPIFLMCDQNDIRIHNRLKDPHLKQPAIFMYDNIPGGVGLAEGAYELRNNLLNKLFNLLDSCKCSGGCPACVGAPSDNISIKRAAADLAKSIINNSKREKFSCSGKKHP